MSVTITGGLLFAVSAKLLPYYENGFYGLLLVVFALQFMMLGKTPLGDMKRSGGVLFSGVVIAGIGIVACFAPGFNRLPRLLLILCLGPGELLLLLQMVLSRSKLRMWVRYGGIFWHLAISCSAVYCLSMLIAYFLWRHSLAATSLMAGLVLTHGIAGLYLAAVLRKVYRTYPGSEQTRGSSGLSADQAMILLTGVFMIILGLMLIPVAFRLLPFSPGAQIGLLMVIFAVGMLATGSTPMGAFVRSWPVAGFGFLFAALGIVSCIVPGILVQPLTILVGVLNIAGGIIALTKICTPRMKKPPGPRPPAIPILTKLFTAQVVLNILSITFGTSMFVPGLVHGSIIGFILAANGGVLLYLLHILTALDRIQEGVT